jgi:hypothetical protein
MLFKSRETGLAKCIEHIGEVKFCPRFQSEILMEDASFKTKACMDI